VDTGDLFPETIGYIAELQPRLGLSIVRYRHGLTEEELTINIRALEGAGLTPQSAFDEMTKVRPMSAILSLYQAKVWIAGNRRDQSRSRVDLPYATVQNDILKVFPLADVTGESVPSLLSALNIPAHPLADRYRSVGNRSDTQESHGPYEKSGRHGGLKEECGLHEAWVRRGRTLVRSGERFVPVDRIPIEPIALK
jgi:phosphoadenosine phosphosulfate reductase